MQTEMFIITNTICVISNTRDKMKYVNNLLFQTIRLRLFTPDVGLISRHTDIKNISYLCVCARSGGQYFS